MKVVLVAVGSEGDVAPVVTIGHELSQRGHDVVVVALEHYAASVRRVGLRLEPIKAAAAPLWPESPALRRLALAQPGAMFATMLRSFQRLAPHTTAALLRASQDADVLVSGTATRGACQVLARQTGARHVSVLYAPLLPAGAAASTCLGIPGFGRPVTLASSQVMWTLTRGLGAAHTVHMARSLRRLRPSGRVPTTLVATSPVVSPPSGTWPEGVEQVGRIRSTMGRDRVPDDVRRFLEAGPPPVVMTYGSSPAARPARDWAMFREASRRAGVRLLVPGAQEGAPSTGRDVMFTGAMDFEELMPHVAAVVHHGGAGTTYTALAGGVPAVVVPHLGDQAYYARRVAELGAGIRSVPRWRLSASLLARMVEAVLEPPVRERAGEIGGLLRSEGDGAARVAGRIEGSAAAA